MYYYNPTEANNRSEIIMTTFNITKIKSAFLDNSATAKILEVKLEGISRRDSRVEHKQVSRDFNNAEDINYNLSMAITQSKKMKLLGREYLNIQITNGPTIDFLEFI
jgi:hypothetical protein